MRIISTDRPSFCVHQQRKTRPGTSGKDRERFRRVIGRPYQGGLHKIADIKTLPCLESDLRRLNELHPRGNLNDLIERQMVKRHHDGYKLGCAGRSAPRMGISGIENLLG